MLRAKEALPTETAIDFGRVWKTLLERERNSYYRRLSLPKDANAFLEPLIERAQAGVEAVAKAA